MPGEQSNLTEFLKAAGRSLSEAQGALAGGIPRIPTAMAISETELEVKATLERTEGGDVALQPVTSGEARQSGISPGVLSTVRVRYVAAPEEAPAGATPAGTAEEAIDAVRSRKDVKALDRILGGLSFGAAFVSSTRHWLVTAEDPDGRLVREVLVPDEGVS